MRGYEPALAGTYVACPGLIRNDVTDTDEIMHVTMRYDESPADDVALNDVLDLFEQNSRLLEPETAAVACVVTARFQVKP